MADSVTAGTVLMLISVGVVLLLGWWRGNRWTSALATLGENLKEWRLHPDKSHSAPETIPELDVFRGELAESLHAQETERRRFVQRLAALERDTLLLQSVLATMVEAVAAVDCESRLLYVNPAARRLLELGEREAAGRLLHEVVRSPRMQAFVAELLSTGVERQSEMDLSREVRTVVVSGSPLPLEPRPGAVLVLHDVSELRRLERMRREFSSNVSHELKTPLTSIQAYADALLDGGLEDAAINRGFVERIVQQAERLGRLIYDLLSLSRVESPAAAAEWETLPLEDVVQEVLPAHLSVAESRGVALHVEFSGEPAWLRCDREGLRTLLNNLVRNALTYTLPGGRVEVRTLIDGEEVVLEVQDTGVGIAREHHERIFERFYRVDKARSRDLGGTGLGLAIVKHLVEQFGGTIEIESEVGRGSLFRVRWPRGIDGPKPEEKPGRS